MLRIVRQLSICPSVWHSGTHLLSRLLSACLLEYFLFCPVRLRCLFVLIFNHQLGSPEPYKNELDCVYLTAFAQHQSRASIRTRQSKSTARYKSGRFQPTSHFFAQILLKVFAKFSQSSKQKFRGFSLD